MKTRLAMRKVIDYYKAACPEIFKDAYLYDIAPQLGTRGSHRIVGEYVISSNDWAFPKEHEDCIAWHCTVDRWDSCSEAIRRSNSASAPSGKN